MNIFFQNFQLYFKSLIKLYGILLLCFAALRLVFIALYWGEINQITANSEIFYAFIAALRLDIAFSSIIIIPVWLIFAFHTIFKYRFFQKLIFIYISIIGFLYILLSTIEMGIYKEWQEKPGIEILTYFDHPEEAFYSAILSDFILLILILIISCWAFYKISKKILANSNEMVQRSWSFVVFFWIFTPFLLLVLGRGGDQSIPVSQSDAYYSKQEILNKIAVNTGYNFIHSIHENSIISSGVNPYSSGDDKKQIARTLAKYLNNRCQSQKILTTTRPNIILVITEGLSGYFIKPENKPNVLIPNYMKLSNKGILFTNVYGSGTLSHEGIPAILSGWPAINNLFISNMPHKFKRLPSLTESLKANNYSSEFVFGGDLNYGNLKSYLYKNSFDHILDEQNISKMSIDENPGRLGYHDEFMFGFLSEITNKTREPFFNTIFTLSSHSPYDQPLQNVIPFGGSDNKYFNSVHYLDQSIGKFIEAAKKSDWYKNTLFVFVSDHSHKVPKNWSRNTPMWHHIPMLFYGDVIKNEFQGKRINKIISQHDLATTLLSQLDIKNDKFIFSRDIFCNDYAEGSYFRSNDGYGFFTEKGAYSYSLKNKKVSFDSYLNAKDSDKKLGHYYLENIVDTILEKNPEKNQSDN